MPKKNADKITDILHMMNETDLINAIRIIQKDIGDKALLKVLEQVASSKTGFDPEEVAKDASGCADMDEREWYSIACDDGYGGYIDSGEHAAEVILDNLQDMFGNDLKQIVSSGDLDSASEFLCAIADGLRQADGILAEENEDYLNEFADHLEECADKKDFKDALNW